MSETRPARTAHWRWWLVYAAVMAGVVGWRYCGIIVHAGIGQNDFEAGMAYRSGEHNVAPEAYRLASKELGSLDTAPNRLHDGPAVVYGARAYGWSPHWWTHGIISGGTAWRPLMMYSLYLDSVVWRNKVYGYHITGALLHLINCLLVAALVVAGSGSPAAGMAAGLLFALSANHRTAVGWVAARAEPLCALGYLVAVVALLRAAAAPTRARCAGWQMASLFGLFVALASKEMAMTAPVMLTLAWLWLTRKSPAVLPAVIGAWAILCAYVAFHALCIGFDVGVRSMWAHPADAWRHLVNNQFPAWSHLRYLSRGFWLGDLASSLLGALSLRMLILLLKVAAVAPAVWYIVSQRGPGFFWLAWRVIVFLPVAPFAMHYQWQYAYLPGIGVCGLIASSWWFLIQGWKRPWLQWLPMAAIVVLYLYEW